MIKDKYLVGINRQELFVYSLNNEQSTAEEIFGQKLTSEIVCFEKIDIDGQWLALSTSNNVVIVYNLLSCKMHTRVECLAPVIKMEIDSRSSALIIAAEYLRILNLNTFQTISVQIMRYQIKSFSLLQNKKTERRYLLVSG